ncbi:MAG: paraquat-inducible protein A [Proteobacteria bacterium]|nr:paraquat-inducible protein A [Pseudomonadota bacterium]
MRFTYYTLATALAFAVLAYSEQEMRFLRIANAHSDIEHSTELAWKSLWEKLSFSIYSGATESRSKTENLLAAARWRHILAERCAIIFFVATCVFLVLQYVRARRANAYLDAEIASDILAISSVCFIVGLFAPIFSLKAQTVVPLLGEVILKYEAKSILTTITSLFDSGSYFIALLILAFSVLTPLTKLLIALLVLQQRWSNWHEHGLTIIHAIGKWSMADVFVVSVFVAYFAARGDSFSDARIELGLYYFSSYCLLSLVAAHIIGHLSSDAETR